MFPRLTMRILAMALSLCLPRTLPAQPTAAPAPYDTVLFKAIRSGDATALQQRLDAGADPNAIYDGSSALMAATRSGSLDQMRLLLDHGAAPNFADQDSITALWLAVPDTARTRLLLDHGADPSLFSKQHYSVLVKLVSFAGTTPLLQSLLAKGADLKKASRDNILLYDAASTGDTTLLGLLLRYGFRPDDTTFFGDYPIIAALNFRCFATVRMLVDNGANVNVHVPNSYLANMHGMTPLMLAAFGDDERSFYYLLDHGADINAKSHSGYTALMYLQLAEADHPDLTKALLAHGAKPSIKTADGADALTLASKKGNTASVQLLKQQ